jgi:hypothetical protein
MPNIIVHPHGDRWSVREDGAESPVKEFPSREAAESAAHQMAAGGTVRVIDQDPTGLDEAGGEIVETGVDEVKAVDAPERARSPQTGL